MLKFTDHDAQIERWQKAAADSLERAGQAELIGDVARARDLRARAVWQTRNAELHQRLLGAGWISEGDMTFPSLNVEEAHAVLDRFEAVPVEDLIVGSEIDEVNRERIGILRRQATLVTFAAAVHASALAEAERMCRVMRDDGVEVDRDALARLMGVPAAALDTDRGEAAS